MFIIPDYKLIVLTTAGAYGHQEEDYPLELIVNYVLPSLGVEEASYKAIKESSAYLENEYLEIHMNFMEMQEQEILSVATPIMDNLMQASTDIDHEKHVQDFTQRAKAIVTEANLKGVCEQYQAEKGTWEKRELVAVLKRPHSAAIIWKQ